MKKIFILLLILFCGLAPSCSGQDNNSQTPVTNEKVDEALKKMQKDIDKIRKDQVDEEKLKDEISKEIEGEIGLLKILLYISLGISVGAFVVAFLKKPSRNEHHHSSQSTSSFNEDNWQTSVERNKLINKVNAMADDVKKLANEVQRLKISKSQQPVILSVSQVNDSDSIPQETKKTQITVSETIYLGSIQEIQGRKLFANCTKTKSDSTLFKASISKNEGEYEPCDISSLKYDFSRPAFELTLQSVNPEVAKGMSIVSRGRIVKEGDFWIIKTPVKVKLS